MNKFVSNCTLFFLLFLLSCDRVEGQKVEEKQHLDHGKVVHFQMPPLPDSMNFAGEKIFFSDWDMKERLDKELHAIVFYHNLILSYFKKTNRFFPEMEKLLKENDLPEDFKYLALIESGLENVTSPSGAQGFWQFLPATAKEYGLLINDYVDERNDLQKSTRAAANYLRTAKDSLHSWVDAAASYNKGVNGFKRDKKWQYSKSYFDTYLNAETSRYVFRILAVKLIFENPEKYGYDLKVIERYPPNETKTVLVNEVKDLALWAKENGINYKILVRLNPWILSNRLPFRTEGYGLLLPVNNQHYGIYRD